MLNLIKKIHGKYVLSTQGYNHVPYETLERVAYCLENKEAFGLESSSGSIWIYVPEVLQIGHYENSEQVHQIIFDEFKYLEMHVISTLYTHYIFQGPVMVHKYLLAVSVLKELKNG